jgi:hypothetical protein
MSFARFAVINDERCVILGQDLGDLLERGVVYEINNILDTLVIRKVGKYALPPTYAEDELHVGACEGSDVNQQVYSAAHLFTIEEYRDMRERQNNKHD